jgi:2'-5' RNA ligase
VRLFVAINLPDRVRERVDAGTRDLRSLPGVRWVPLLNIHLTLSFIGEVGEGRAADVERVVREVAAGHRPFEAQITVPGAFPSLRRPRVIWLGLAAGEALSALQRDLEEQLETVGIGREDRPFRAHLTLGRTRRGQRIDGPALDALVRRAAVSASWWVRRVDLMRSHLRPSGAEYEVLASAALAGESRDEGRRD